MSDCVCTMYECVCVSERDIVLWYKKVCVWHWIDSLYPKYVLYAFLQLLLSLTFFMSVR